MCQPIRYYGVQSHAHHDFYVRVEHRPLTRFGLDGKKWHAYPLLSQEDVQLKTPTTNRRADYVFVDPSFKPDRQGCIDVYLVSAQEENVKILIPACRFGVISA